MNTTAPSSGDADHQWLIFVKNKDDLNHVFDVWMFRVYATDPTTILKLNIGPRRTMIE